MAEKKSVKIAQISKDFNVKTKDVLDIFKDAGIEKKSGAAVETDEYELFLHIATKSHQIKNIDDYLDGKTKITVLVRSIGGVIAVRSSNDHTDTR